MVSIPIPKSIPEYAYDALVAEIRRFQDGLPDDMEMAIVANGAGLAIHPETMRLSDHMVVFDGIDGSGRQARLIQHYSQINVQLLAVEKLDARARRMGFWSAPRLF
jgi:hypothetical protein